MNEPAAISTELLLRYDQPGPRYTSYPTAPVWTEDFGEREWREALARANRRSAAPFSLYVHIPFCRSMCFYCGCNVVVTQREEKAREYVDVMLKEVALLAEALPDRRTLKQHHWGGGTPTYLPPEEIVRLYRGIEARFPPAGDAEISIEVDPRVTTFDHLEALHHLGFRRISMGVQDFTPKVQQAIHRVQSRELTKSLVDEARRVGFTSVNVDLVYGLPHQEPETFGETIETILDWKIDRIACYSYAHVPWLKKHQRALPEEALPGREEKFALLALALETFGRAGYEMIGFDHFARAEDDLAWAAREGKLHRNFMGYSTRMEAGREGEDMLMLGVTSIGEVAGAFGQNPKERRDWAGAISEGRLPVHRGHRRNAEDEERRRIILDIMCDYRVEFANFEAEGRPPFRERYAKALRSLEPLVEDGLLELGDEALVVTPKGRVFLRNICMPFDAYLEKQRAEGRPMFSRTV